MKYKIGDRVAVYGDISPIDGGTVVDSNGLRGTVVSVTKTHIQVRMDKLVQYFHASEDDVVEVHPKQCRKLKPKPVSDAEKIYECLGCDSLAARVRELEEEKEQWEPEWKSQAEANAAGFNEAHSKFQAKLENYENHLHLALSALELIASPKRSDGTYNRSREACEKLAKETLKKLGN